MTKSSGRPPVPPGFRFLAVCALLCAAAMIVPLLRRVPPDGQLDRVMVVVIALLALITAEALAFVRPWAFRATVALASAFPIAIIVWMRSMLDGIAMSGPGLLFGVVAIAIVHHGLAAASPSVKPRHP